MLNFQLSLMLEQNKKYAHCLKVCVYVACGGLTAIKVEPLIILIRFACNKS